MSAVPIMQVLLKCDYVNRGTVHTIYLLDWSFFHNFFGIGVFLNKYPERERNKDK